MMFEVLMKTSGNKKVVYKYKKQNGFCMKCHADDIQVLFKMFFSRFVDFPRGY